MEKLLKTAAVLLITVCLILCSSGTKARADTEGAGTVTASAKTVLEVPVEKYLLIEVSEI